MTSTPTLYRGKNEKAHTDKESVTQIYINRAKVNEDKWKRERERERERERKGEGRGEGREKYAVIITTRLWIEQRVSRASDQAKRFENQPWKRSELRDKLLMSTSFRYLSVHARMEKFSQAYDRQSETVRIRVNYPHTTLSLSLSIYIYIYICIYCLWEREIKL